MKRALALVILVVACKPPANTAAPDAAVKSSSASGPQKRARPPHPAMATSLHGQQVLDQLVAENKLEVKSGAVNADAYKMLGSMEDGCEENAQHHFTAAWKAAQNEQTRIESVAGIMLSLVLNPEPRGYSDRLTDAYGMQLMLAGSQLAGAPVASARALVQAAAGRVEDARTLAKQIRDGKFKDAWIRHNESQAWFFIRQRGFALDAINAAAELADAPPRVFYERARLLLNMRDPDGAATNAARALSATPNCTRCKVLHAQALALGPARDDGIKEIDTLLAAQLPAYLDADLHAAGAVARIRAGKAADAQQHAEALTRVKGYEGEAAVTSGLIALAQNNAPQAALALDAAVKMVPAGWLRSEALLALAKAAIAEKNGQRALAALKALETDDGPSAETAESMADAFALLGQTKEAEQERLRAHVLDPFSAARAKASGRAARGGGDAARDASRRGWRLLGTGAFSDAMSAFKSAESSDPNDPYLAYGRMLAQQGIDTTLPVGEQASDLASVAAADAVKRCGKEPVHKVFPAEARRALLDALDVGARNLTLDAIKKFTKDPDPDLARLAEEAAARPAPRPRATAR